MIVKRNSLNFSNPLISMVFALAFFGSLASHAAVTDELFQAVSEGNEARVKTLANTDPFGFSRAMKEKNAQGNTPLAVAAQGGHEKIVRFMATQDPFGFSHAMREKNALGNTTLALAAQKGHEEIVRFLATQDPFGFSHAMREKNAQGNTPLALAMQEGREEIVGFMKTQDPFGFSHAMKEKNYDGLTPNQMQGQGGGAAMGPAQSGGWGTTSSAAAAYEAVCIPAAGSSVISDCVGKINKIFDERKAALQQLSDRVDRVIACKDNVMAKFKAQSDNLLALQAQKHAELLTEWKSASTSYGKSSAKSKVDQAQRDNPKEFEKLHKIREKELRDCEKIP